jgi:UDP-GlcNAc:undecaprenyl-phosphate GlcNAc-1-phosphate transferase
MRRGAPASLDRSVSRLLLTTLVAFVLSAGLTGVVRMAAPRLGLVDQPRADRWHRRPVPRLGGIAMYASFVATMLFFLHAPLSRPVLGALLGTTVIFLVGLVDDLRSLENRPKLVLLIAAAGLPVLFGVRFGAMPAVVAGPLTMLWLLGATNAMNWLDNMDGLAAGVGAIAAATLLGVALAAGPAASMAAALLGVSLGFLIHNFPPARIFMGDAGSGFLGLALAVAATLGSARNVTHVLMSLLTPGLILAVPIFDSLMVIWQRVVHGRSVFQGGRDHLSHRMVVMGLSERRAVVLFYVLSALAGASGLVAWHLGMLVGLSVGLLIALGFAAVGAVLAEVRVYDAPDGAGTGRLPGVVRNKRWMVAMALDLVLLQVAFVGAHLLRFEGVLPAPVAEGVTGVLPAVAVLKMAVLFTLGVYSGQWRYAGLIDVIRLAQAGTAASAVATVGLYAWTDLRGFSRAALIMDWIFTIGLLSAARLGIRAAREYLVANRQQGHRVLIAGVGAHGARFVAALREMPDLGYLPVGFVAETAEQRGTVVQGLPVLGDVANLETLLRSRLVEAVIVVPEDLNGADTQVQRICEGAGIPVLRTGRLLEPLRSVEDG